ncbi:RNA-directed DNA polymerase, eukaryota, reverse transcriptase zinc-binding domain protein [Tanacetum coccineum]
MSFVGSSAEKGMDKSTIKVHGSTLPGSVSRNYGEKGTEHVFSPPMSSRLDFVITRKKLIHNSIDESKKPFLKPSPKSGWNVDVVHLMVLSQSSQALHVKVFHKATNKTMFCSFIYAGNLQTERRLLWADLGIHRNVVRGFSWILMGDFNVALNMEDIYAGSSSFNSAMCEFKDCVTRIEELITIIQNLNRIFSPFNENPPILPAILKIPNLTSPKLKPFKIFNFLAFKSKFVELVECHWNSNVERHNMFKLVSNMKALKKPLRKLLHDHGNLHERVNKLRIELDVVQKALDLNPANSYLREEESVYLKAFNDAKLDEERFLKQKAKIDWLEAGDSNSCRNQRSRIEVVVNSDNIEVSGSHVPKRGKAKVAWDDICLPKEEGGLGLRSLDVFNIALMTTHIWNIVSNKESLWVRWIHTYKLRGRSFWDIPFKDGMSWGWLKLLQLRDIVRPFFWVKLAPDLGLIPDPVLDLSRADVRQWRDNNGSFSVFSVAKAWETLRPRGTQAPWVRIVWFSHDIPRHAFHLCSYADFGLYFDAGIGFYYDSGLINLSCGHVSGLNTGFWKCNTIYIIDKGSRLEWLKDFSSDLVRILGSLNFQALKACCMIHKVLNFKDFMVSNQVWAG